MDAHSVLNTKRSPDSSVAVRITLMRMRIRILLFHFEADADRNLPFNLMQIRIRILLFKLIRIPHFFPDLDPPNAPTGLFHFDAVPDPDLAFHFDADPDPAFHFFVDLDPDPASQNDVNPCGFRSTTVPGTRILLDPDGQQ